jgi:hypothetical protein
MLRSARAPGACWSWPFTRRAELVEHPMLKNLWRVCRWGASRAPLLLLGCEDTGTPRCVPGESVACVGVGDCAGLKVCDTNGIVFGSCMCPVPVVERSPRSSSSVPSACVLGSTRACLGADGCEGVATCGDSATFGACQCAGGTIRVPGLRPNVLGAACQNDSECGSSLSCWAEYESGPGQRAGLPAATAPPPAAARQTARCSSKPATA